MGNVIDPKPAQWQRREPVEDVSEDRVLMLVDGLMAALNKEVDSTLVQLVAIRLIMKGVVGSYRSCMGHENARELMRQASAMAEQYTIKGIDETQDT